MQVNKFVVTVLKPKSLSRVSYGPYMTTCRPDYVWDVKKKMLELPIICPTCKKVS